MTRGFRRLAWSSGDQALSSLTNVALTIVVARSASAAQFGTFALLMSGYLLALFVVRGMTSDPFVSLHSGRDPVSLMRSARDSSGTALLTGLCLAAGFVVTALVLPGERAAVVAFGVALPGVLLQDHLRYLSFALGQPRRAFVLDAVWAAVQALALVVVLALGSGELALLILAWGASGSAAAVVGLVLVRLRPRVLGMRAWLRSTKSLWRYYAIENLLLQATNLIVLAAVALIAGVTATGALRGAVTLYSPLALFAAGAIAAGVPELARLSKRRPDRVMWASLWSGACLGLVALAWTSVIIVMPDGLGARILGDTWEQAAPLLVFVGIDQIAVLAVLGPFMGLRAMGRREGMATRGWLSLVRLAAALAGAWWDGAHGAAVGFAVLAPLQVAVWTTALLRSPPTETVARGDSDLPQQVADITAVERGLP